MSQQAAKRRRAQAKGGYKHMSPMQRPHYKVRSAAAARRHLEALVAKENRIRQGKGKKK